MWTRSAKDKATGLMTVVCTDYNGQEFYRGEFTDLMEANKAGEDAERRMMAKMNAPVSSGEFSSMSDDELLAVLLD